ncbi:hypothetical protein DFH11DRAFT_178638 [Phellopilus nigrolimitatus]|nr:hypothetical protein DFH11DRAFT_178638 [Phellopilus nigrolimitatus]
MPWWRLTFAQGRSFLLFYVTTVSFLSFSICLSILPTAGRKVSDLALISGSSLVIGLVSFFALFGSKLRLCRCAFGGQYVGLEAIWAVVLLPVAIMDAVLSTTVSESQSARNGPQGSSTRPTSFNISALLALSNILITFSGSVGILLASYATLLVGLAVYTHKRTRSANVWFSDLAAHTPPFVFPAFLSFLRSLGHENDDSDPHDTLLDPQFLLSASSTLPGVNFATYGRNTALHMPGCACSEKLPISPSGPEEFRALHRVYRSVWSQVAFEAGKGTSGLYGYIPKWIDGGLFGHRRAMSAPVPMLRLPTSRDQRRSLYNVGFDTV